MTLLVAWRPQALTIRGSQHEAQKERRLYRFLPNKQQESWIYSGLAMRFSAIFTSLSFFQNMG